MYARLMYAIVMDFMGSIFGAALRDIILFE